MTMNFQTNAKLKTRLSRSQVTRLNETVAFSQDTSNKTGLSERAIQQDVQIATVLDDEERKIVKRVDILRITSRSKLRSVPLMKYSMLLGFLVLVSIAGAELDTVTMGPYEVSFDMEDIEYEILDYTVKECETYSGIVYMFYHFAVAPASDGGIAIGITEYQCDQTVHLVEDIYNAIDGGADIYFRNIDDRNSYLFVGEKHLLDIDILPVHKIVYSLESDEWTFPDRGGGDPYLKCKNFVDIASYADWDTTRQFLNTVHVERISE